jgi:hypothetical protein
MVLRRSGHSSFCDLPLLLESRSARFLIRMVGVALSGLSGSSPGEERASMQLCLMHAAVYGQWHLNKPRPCVQHRLFAEVLHLHLPTHLHMELLGMTNPSGTAGPLVAVASELVDG